MHNTSHAPLSKRGEIFSPWAASLLIAGRRGNLLLSKKSVSGFKLKENSLLGCCLSLRGESLYQFLDKFFLETLPRELSNRPENWTPAVEWESVCSVGEFFLPCIREKTVFPAVPALVIIDDMKTANPLENMSLASPSQPFAAVPAVPAVPAEQELQELQQKQGQGVSSLSMSNARSISFKGKPNPVSLGEGKRVTLPFGELKEKTSQDVESLSRCQTSQHSSFLSQIELEKKLSGKRKIRGVKALSKQYNLGVRFCFSFRDLEYCFHLFQYLRGFDITLLFSTSLKVVCLESPQTESKVSK